MDIKGLRTLNLVGTILFCIIGITLVSVQYYQLYLYREAQREIGDLIGGVGGALESDNSRDSKYAFCIGLLILWLFIIIIFTILFYIFIVKGLDRGNYKAAKEWTLVGIIVGFAGGIVPFIIFIISYVSFDGAIRNKQLDQTQYSYSQQFGQARYCKSCRKQIPFDSNLCPYCGVQQSPLNPYRKPPPLP